ncbi:MAG: hypothetical protein A2W80_08395 [Candidatus Riflebacteria bacterium GWC2_50_8]|nr:MAG: hypothetical protein A2W80_08395 [Candidatus Riflebacteria bacterium GWC2_50_8]
MFVSGIKNLNNFPRRHYVKNSMFEGDMKPLKTILCIIMLVLNTSFCLLGQIPNYEQRMIYEVTFKSGSTIALDTIEEFNGAYRSTTETQAGSITFVYPKNTVKSVEQRQVYIWNGPAPVRMVRRTIVSSAPQSQQNPTPPQPNHAPESGQNNLPSKILIGYKAETGKRLHKTLNCSQATIPVYEGEEFQSAPRCKTCFGLQ